MARDRDLENARLVVCRGCTGYIMTPLLPNCACRYCGEHGSLPIQQINIPPDQSFLNGPDENCPLGNWKGLVPLDASDIIQQEKERLEAGATKFIELTTPFHEQMTTVKYTACIDTLVADGLVHKDRADEVKKQLGIKAVEI